MQKGKFQIVYMGTPDFAVPALEALTNAGHNVQLVITQPDRPKGRGRKLAPPPVKTAARNLGLAVRQPEKINTPDLKKALEDVSPDLFIVTAFGQILTREILDIPALYPINIHASLLPQYRGASPIQGAISNMEKETGITTMVMEEKLDAGDILMTSKMPINPEDTAGTLHDKLARAGASLIVETLDGLAAGALTPVPQNEEEATFTRLLQKSDGKIDWQKNADEICAHIRAMNPWPGAFTHLDDRTVKIFCARPARENSGASPGTITSPGGNGIRVAAKENSVDILELMGKSGKRLGANDFLRGAALEKGMVFH